MAGGDDEGLLPRQLKAWDLVVRVQPGDPESSGSPELDEEAQQDERRADGVESVALLGHPPNLHLTKIYVLPTPTTMPER